MKRLHRSDHLHAVAFVAAIAAVALTIRVFIAVNGAWRPVALVFVGVAIGSVLFATNFGFSAAFRKASLAGDFATFRAHAVMLALGSLLMVPVIAAGSLFGQHMMDFATPIGVSFLVGALLFGVGMQMSGGCASGTLFLLGGGNLKYVCTLVFFVVGSAVGAAHLDFWRTLPALDPVTVFSLGPWPIVLAIEIAALVAAFLWLPSPSKLRRPEMIGAVALALLNFATLLIAGRPWSETYGFALWGSKIAAGIGFHPETWGFWGDGSALTHSIFADLTSIMDGSIILGALLAAGLTRRFRLTFDGDWSSWLAAAFGGLMMGYGARLADGCNIGAYFSAIVSGSFSGYVWAVMAILGSFVGVQLRRMIEGWGAARVLARE